MVFYCFNIGYFPTDLSISDTFILIALAFIFGLLYCFTLLALKAYSNLVFWFLLLLFNKFFKNEPENCRGNHSINYRELTKYCYRKYKPNLDTFFHLIFSTFWLLSLLLSRMIGWIEILSIFAVIFAASMLYERSLFEHFERKVDAVLGGEGINRIEFTNRKNFIITIVLMFALLIPIVSGMVSKNYIDSSMQVLNLADNNVSAHIQHPYDQYLVEYGIRANESSFGDDYVKAENVDVLMQGLGSNVVLSIPKKIKNNKNKKVKVIIPKDKVHIIDNKF